MSFQARKTPRAGFAARAAAGLALACMAAWISLSFYAQRRIAQFKAGGMDEGFTTRVYSAPFVLASGSSAAPDMILERLSLLGYASSGTSAPGIGACAWNFPVLKIGLRGFKSPGARQKAGLFSLSWTRNRWSIADSSGNAAAEISLEPMIMAELSGPRGILREPLAAPQIPPMLKSAVIAAEDRRFYRHGAFDFRGIARAFWADVRRPGRLEGGSTITQQLAKNLFLSPQRTFKRKIIEAALAFYLETKFSKDRILALYLGHIYWGQDGTHSVSGARSASRLYFGKNLRSLSIGQCALLAGLIRSPYLYNPFLHPKAALLRRDQVLNQMRAQGIITIWELRQALGEPLGVVRRIPTPPKIRDADYFTAEVVRELVPRYGEDAVFRKGLSIYTVMDPVLQKAAQESVANKAAPHEGALVAIEPTSGAVLALSGGRDFGKSEFNRATQALRQPGSAFKPFLYGAALEKGWTAASWLSDEPRAYSGGLGKPLWRPRNDENKFYGRVSLREALARSLNGASLDLARKIGVAAVVSFAKRLGLESPVQNNLAAMIGSCDTTLLDLTAAYAPFSNGGLRVRPFLIAQVQDANGQILESWIPKRHPAISPALAYVMTSLLSGVFKQGTARGAAKMGWALPSAGKTGTTNGGADAWFIGYTPRLLAGVWVGDDAHRPLGLYGAANALPVWVAFMSRAARENAAPENFIMPPGVAEAVIDPQSGFLARSGCPTRMSEAFLAGTQPREYCPLHSGGIKGWFHRLIRRRSRPKD
ncbi:MAG: penicillin-binding protein 1A [Elusimicrobiota bacterium]